MTPITPGSRPPSRSAGPAAPTSAPAASAAPLSAPTSASPADSGQPFRATLTNAAINSARAERQRTVIPPRPTTTTARPSSPAAAGSATDYSLPMPAQRPAAETAEPGSRANWPLINAGDEASAPAASGAGLNGTAAQRHRPSTAPASTAPAPAQRHCGRVKPPWQDMPKEPPALRLVEPQLGDRRDTTVPDLPAISDPPSLRVVEGEGARNGRIRRGSVSASASITSNTSSTLTALDRSTTPPVPAESNDGDLLIFAAARSAWFTGHAEVTPDLNWANPNDTGWRAAEKAATPEVAAETAAGLPKRVPQANLVPGSPLREERPLRIVRDAASIAAHTTGYFRGWRRGPGDRRLRHGRPPGPRVRRRLGLHPRRPERRRLPQQRGRLPPLTPTTSQTAAISPAAVFHQPVTPPSPRPRGRISTQVGAELDPFRTAGTEPRHFKRPDKTFWSVSAKLGR